MTREEKLILARELQDNPLWAEILDEMRKRNLQAWATEQDPVKREDCWQYNRILGEVSLAVKNALNYTPNEE